MSILNKNLDVDAVRLRDMFDITVDVNWGKVYTRPSEGYNELIGNTVIADSWEKAVEDAAWRAIVETMVLTNSSGLKKDYRVHWTHSNKKHTFNIKDEVGCSYIKIVLSEHSFFNFKINGKQKNYINRRARHR